MKRTLVVVSMLASIAVARTPAVANAQEIEVKGPLAGAPAVIGLRVYRELRLQVQLHGAVTLTDEYTQTVFTGGQLMFHIWDWFGFGVWGGYGVTHIDTSLTNEISEKGFSIESNVISLPTKEGFPDQIGKLTWIAAPQATFIPLRGKLGIFESLFLDTDFYLFGGVAFIGLEERVTVNQADCEGNNLPLAEQQQRCAGSQDTEARTAMAPTFGVGLSLYMTDYLALTLEWRAFPFSWNTGGTDEVRDPRRSNVIDDDDRLPHFNHLFALGLAFYLPTEPGHAYTDVD